MSTLSFVYPSFTLAELGDPLSIARTPGASMDLDGVLSRVREAVQSRLAELTAPAPASGRADDRWYWAAPLLLDLASDRIDAQSWLDRNHLSYYWVGEDPAVVSADPQAVGAERGWRAHVQQLRRLGDGRLEPLGKAPEDLADVLALLAVAGPANCALRALARGHAREELRRVTTRDAAAQVAQEFRALFNAPEVVAMLRAQTDDDEAYWRAALRYCADGVLQSVLDEWAHVLVESEGLTTSPLEGRIGPLARAMRDALAIRSAQVNALYHTVHEGDVVIGDERYRSRFALRFGDADTVDDSRKAMRSSYVRSAFNSPFWPFVLASTTVGQEGLDFHPYCHAVVHWNLPHNPVDLEQREGRVHRYKGHAVRKNVARAFGNRTLSAGSDDPWSHMFSAAANSRSEHSTDMVPYWVFPVDGGAHIERHVPSLPMSRDRERLEQLRRALVLYRMVFGQPRQDELVQYLAAVLPAASAEDVSEQLRIDLAPPSPGLAAIART